MKRRNFLLAGAGGLMIPWWSVIPEARAQSAGLYSGRILVNIHAGGGIDQSSWTDPREKDKTLNHYAGVTPANVSGNIRSAPMGSNKAFFDSYFKACSYVPANYTDRFCSFAQMVVQLLKEASSYREPKTV